jgi:hypothetical protein
VAGGAREEREGFSSFSLYSSRTSFLRGESSEEKNKKKTARQSLGAVRGVVN